MKKNALIIFIKYPELGKVKTRLAATTSDSFACRFYEAVSGKIFDEIEKLESVADKFIFYAPTENFEKLRNWVKYDFKYAEQKGNDLGDKITNAFEQLFDKGYKRLIILGSDIPGINENLVRNAFNSLEVNNIVIAPSDDGGYSLLGLDSFYPYLFKNIDWSTDRVFKQTEQVIVEQNLSFKVLEKLNDVDTEKELKQWLDCSADHGFVKKILTIAKEENIKL